jgi:hypothetical protein
MSDRYHCLHLINGASLQVNSIDWHDMPTLLRYSRASNGMTEAVHNHGHLIANDPLRVKSIAQALLVSLLG